MREAVDACNHLAAQRTAEERTRLQCAAEEYDREAEQWSRYEVVAQVAVGVALGLLVYCVGRRSYAGACADKLSHLAACAHPAGGSC